MNILTHIEAKALRNEYMSDPFELIREVESAVIKAMRLVPEGSLK